MGKTSSCSGRGSFTPTVGETTMSRSVTAAPKMLATSWWSVRTEEGAKTSLRPLIQVRNSEVRMAPIGRSPRNGSTWQRKLVSTRAAVFGL